MGYNSELGEEYVFDNVEKIFTSPLKIFDVLKIPKVSSTKETLHWHLFFLCVCLS